MKLKEKVSKEVEKDKLKVTPFLKTLNKSVSCFIDKPNNQNSYQKLNRKKIEFVKFNEILKSSKNLSKTYSFTSFSDNDDKEKKSIDSVRKKEILLKYPELMKILDKTRMVLEKSTQNNRSEIKIDK